MLRWNWVLLAGLLTFHVRAQECGSTAGGAPGQVAGPLSFHFAGGDVLLESSSRGLLSADFDGDGAADLAALEREAGASRVLILGSRPPHLEELDALDVAGAALAFAVGDLHADGDADVAVLSVATLTVFLNRGGGTFQPGVAVEAPEASALTLLDLEADGLAEIVVLSSSGGMLTPFRSAAAGAGTFTAAGAVATEAEPRAAGAGDFDGDGRAELAVLHGGSSAVHVFSGEGATLGAPRVFDGGVDDPFLIQTADLDGDGRDDVGVGAQAGVAVVLSAAGGFGAPRLHTGMGRLTSFLLAEVNGDGRSDLVFSVAASDVVSIRLGSGDGAFEPASTLPIGWAARHLAAADFDGDGDVDLAGVVGDATESRVTVASNGPFAAAPDFAFDTSTVRITGRPHAVSPGDFNADGLDDAATVNGGQGSFTVLFGTARDGLEVSQTYIPRQRAALFSMTEGDYDADGDIDLVGADIWGNQLILRTNAGDGTFAEVSFVPVGASPLTVSTAEIDGDGAPDLLAVSQQSNLVGVLRNTGGGTFAAAVHVRTPSGPLAVAAGDLAGDSDQDLAVANATAREVSLHASNGDGTFAAPRSLPVLGGIRHVEIADLERDGGPEILLVEDSFITVLRGDGGGNFSQVLALETHQHPYSLFVVDADGDGHLDVVAPNTINPTYGSLSFLLAAGAATFLPPVRFIVGAEPRFAMAGDIDGDGDTDFVSANRTSETITVLSRRRAAGDCTFRRADVNGDARFNLLDVLEVLAQLFAGAPQTCADAADVNDDGALNVTDAVAFLNYLFSGGPPPAAPFPEPGTDPTSDDLGCG